MMVARIELTLDGRKERTHIPTRNEHDVPLSEEAVLGLLRMAVIDLYYIALGGLDEEPAPPPPPPPRRVQLCLCGHSRSQHV